MKQPNAPSESETIEKNQYAETTARPIENGLKSLRPAVTGVFGLAVIGSGLWRFLSREGGQAGLWFGLVMGGLAVLASILFMLRKTPFALVLTWLCIAFVGGWFCYEALIKKGWAIAETRQLIIIAMTALTAVFHLVAAQRKSK